MHPFAEAAGDLALAAFVRLVGALWVVGAVILVRQLRAQAALDRMLNQLTQAADGLADDPALPVDERPVRRAADPD